jgi:hypothetical protein
MDDRASHGLESVHVVVMTGGSRTYSRIFRTLVSYSELYRTLLSGSKKWPMFAKIGCFLLRLSDTPLSRRTFTER